MVLQQGGLDLPSDTFASEVTPASARELKKSHRRSDDFIYLDPAEIAVLPGLNVRIRTPAYLERVRSLADDMKERGFKRDCPITCFYESRDGEKRVVVAGGHTRLEAVRLAISEGADIDVIPVCLLPRETSMDDLLADVQVANSGTPLSMLEQAILVKRYRNRGWDDAEIAKRLRFTTTHVNSLVLLAAAPKAIHQMIAQDQITATAALEVIRQRGVEGALEYLRTKLEALKEGGASKLRIKPAMLPEAKFRNAVKRNAPKLLDKVRQVAADPAFSQLSADTRAALTEILDDIEKIRLENGIAADVEELDPNQQPLPLAAA